MHKINRGDSLFSIARKYRVSIQKIRELNPDLNAGTLRLGREIAVPIPGIVSKTPGDLAIKKQDLS